jgi:hypothetical protein
MVDGGSSISDVLCALELWLAARGLIDNHGKKTARFLFATCGDWVLLSSLCVFVLSICLFVLFVLFVCVCFVCLCLFVCLYCCILSFSSGFEDRSAAELGSGVWQEAPAARVLERLDQRESEELICLLCCFLILQQIAFTAVYPRKKVSHCVVCLFLLLLFSFVLFAVLLALSFVCFVLFVLFCCLFCFVLFALSFAVVCAGRQHGQDARESERGAHRKVLFVFVICTRSGCDAVSCRHHSGIDDARNIARICTIVLFFVCLLICCFVQACR